jgi:hypothetical protein
MNCVFIKYVYNNNACEFLVHKSDFKDIYILKLLWNQEMIYSLKMCFHRRKYKKIINLRERLSLTQVIINQKMMKLSLE